MSSKTKARIIQCAIQLFNEHGSSSISTNHIAKELGISPGNLYYHFKNKEEIIREILNTMIADWDTLWLPPAEDWEPSVADIKLMIRMSLQLEWKYRFFYRELLTLLKLDPLLKKAHQNIQRQRTAEQKALFQLFIEAGVLRQPTELKEIEAFITTSWIISNYWLSFLEANGVEVTEESMEEGIDLIMTVLQPYILTDASNEEL